MQMAEVEKVSKGTAAIISASTLAAVIAAAAFDRIWGAWFWATGLAGFGMLILFHAHQSRRDRGLQADMFQQTRSKPWFLLCIGSLFLLGACLSAIVSPGGETQSG